MDVLNKQSTKSGTIPYCDETKLASVWMSASTDQFLAVSVDRDNNLVAAGYSEKRSRSIHETSLMRFDKDLNLLSKKDDVSIASIHYSDATIDSNGNIIYIGYTPSEEQIGNTPIISKFDGEFELINQRLPLEDMIVKSLSVETVTRFYAVTTDSQNNIICVGRTVSEEPNNNEYNIIVMKFDSSLNILSHKLFSGPDYERGY